jgi:hypothetical protein
MRVKLPMDMGPPDRDKMLMEDAASAKLLGDQAL